MNFAAQQFTMYPNPGGAGDRSIASSARAGEHLTCLREQDRPAGDLMPRPRDDGIE